MRGGSTRSGLSAPRRASDTSFAKLAATWIDSAATRVRANASQRKTPSPQASPPPTATGTTAAGSVWMRAAVLQSWAVVTGSEVPGEPGEVGLALLQERIPALTGLVGHVAQPGGLAG